jgi:DNA helicase HerA-like ATPase
MIDPDRISHIGHRGVWGGTRPFGVCRSDRRQHLFLIGKSGVGKSTLLRNLILEDIAAGEGIGLIDPHGDLAEEILDHLPPRRSRDVIYFNPSDLEYPIAFARIFDCLGVQKHLAGFMGATA